MLTKKKASTTAVKTPLSVDYPGQNEVITSAHYAIRMSAPKGAERVQLTINDGPWLECRNAVGYWWYDWTGFDDGKHVVSARIPSKEGRHTRSAPVVIIVDRRKPS